MHSAHQPPAPRGPPDNNFDFKRLCETHSPGPRRSPRGAIECSCNMRRRRQNVRTTNNFPREKNVSTFGRNEYVGKQGTADSVAPESGSHDQLSTGPPDSRYIEVGPMAIDCLPGTVTPRQADRGPEATNKQTWSLNLDQACAVTAAECDD